MNCEYRIVCCTSVVVNKINVWCLHCYVVFVIISSIFYRTHMLALFSSRDSAAPFVQCDISEARV